MNILTAVMESNLVFHHNSIVGYGFGLSGFAEDLGSFLCSTVDKLDERSRNKMFKSLPYVFIDL